VQVQAFHVKCKITGCPQKVSHKLLSISSPKIDRFSKFFSVTHFVVTQLRCGVMYCHCFITHFPQNVPVKKIWKSVNIWRRYGQKFVVYFLGHPVHCKIMQRA